MRPPNRASAPLVGLVMAAVMGSVGFGAYKAVSSPDVRWTNKDSVIRGGTEPPSFKDWIG